MVNTEGVLRIILNDISKSFCFVSTIYTILNRFSNEFYDVYRKQFSHFIAWRFYENRFSCQGLTSHTPLRFPFLRSSRPKSLAEAEGIPGIGPVKHHAVVPKILEAIAKWEKNGS